MAFTSCNPGRHEPVAGPAPASRNLYIQPLGWKSQLGYLRINRGDLTTHERTFPCILHPCAKPLLTIHGNNLGLLQRWLRHTSTRGFRELVEFQAEGTALLKTGLTKIDEATREPKSLCVNSPSTSPRACSKRASGSESHHRFGAVQAENNSKTATVAPL